MWLLDFPSLWLIIAAGLQIGMQGFFGVDAAGKLVGGYEKFLFIAMGISALWQIFRQKFF